MKRALELEMKSIGGQRLLPAAFEAHVQQWQAGNCTRETALHLAMLAWYLIFEPAFLTDVELETQQLAAVFREMHDWLLPDGVESPDAEALYTLGWGASMIPWALGDESIWLARAQAYRARSGKLSPSVFEGRGYYGEYFAHIARGSY
jgi:hypothetical protein